ncbi:hypothetical protein ZIOFF_067243 [Zingiber officinale]|uniref:dUTP diphosphatase n=1 Tax=Zingiber officinale TaxID=94328 RepID=A0A8J5EUL6_ZINOF|nr:hypothetical protein ZIOFF_067243 [Zingiber officinale]
MLITGSDQQDRTFIMEDSYERLAQAELEYIHLGILQVRFQILHRRYAGTMALIVFRDTRWNTDDRSIIAAMEIDLAEGHQLIYVMPNIMLTIKDFFRHIQISIQTRGYESWEGAEANLLVTRSITARLSNTPNVGFAFRVEKVAEYLRSKGVKAIDATKHSATKFQGSQWNLRPSRVILPTQPSSLLSSTNYDGSTSIQFGGYQPAASSKAPLYNKEDDETDEEHIVSVITIIDDSLDDYPVLIAPNALLQDYPALAAFEDSLLQSMVGEDEESESEESESEEEALSKILEETTISSQRSRYNINTTLDDYPELQNIERILSTGESAISNYRPPQDEEMDIPGYAPAGSSRGWAGIEEANLAGKRPKKWENNSEWFQLPSANAKRGMNESDLSDIYSVSEGEDLTYQPEEFDIFMLRQTDISQETLKIRRTHPLAFLPQRKTEGAAGYDLATCEGCVLTPHSHAILNTGISIKLPEGTYGRIAPRSGLSAKGIFINGGVIDADFRGSIQVILFNFSFENILFNIGDNIAQLIIEKIALPEVEEVQFLDQTPRGSQSFGSTDKQEEKKVSAAFKPVPIPINMLQVIEDEPSEYLIGESEWRSQMRVSRKEYLCQHDWSYDETTAADCRDCKLEARAGNRIDCRKCKLIICSLCTYHCFKISWPSTIRTQMKKTDWKSLSALQSNLIQKLIRRENELEEEVKNLRQQISGMEELAIIQEAPSEYERELTEVQQENAFLKLMNEKQQKEIEALKQEKQLLLELGEINKKELIDLKTRLLVPSSLPVLTFDEYYVNAAPQRNNLLNIKPHIIQNILETKSESLTEIRALRRWLGILNYARAYIPNLGKTLGPLYSKTSVKGERRMNTQDWKIIEQIKQQVQNLPDLEIPPPDAIILLETDGCMEGWGGICKWKTSKGEPRTSEKICAYASGRFLPVKSTIDAEVQAVINSLEKFKIYYLDKSELIIRTDSHAIVKFYEKASDHKPSRVRWLTLSDYISGIGIKVSFEHISGKDNVLADELSRLITTILVDKWEHTLLHPLTKAINEVLQKPNPVMEARMASHILNALKTSKKGNELVNVIINNQISLQCACGRDAALLVSHTSRNPGRHFYKCSTDTCHSWYWADLIENYVQQRLNMEAPLAQEPINWVNIEQHGYWDNDPVWEEPGLGEPEVINDDGANSEIDDPTEDSSLFHQHLD